MIYPRIGIRPAIDGRFGGIREGAEERTMEMARSAKQLIETLRYPDGTHVQAVIAPSTISNGVESALCDEAFSSQNVVATLTVTPCWCYGTETFDMNPMTIKAVWGLNCTERPGAVYLAAVMAAYAQQGLPAFAIYGKEVQDEKDSTIPADVQEKLMRFAKASVAVGWMRNKAYVNIGGVAMGIMGSYCDNRMMQKTFGIRAEWVDMTEILRRMTLQIYDPDEYQTAFSWVKQNCKEGIDRNAGKEYPDSIRRSKVIPPEQDWDFVIKMTLILKDILHGNPKLKELGWPEEAMGKNAVAGGFQGQRQWTDWLPNGDFSETLLASTFDWNGAKEPTPFATENDTLNGLTMLMGTLLSQTAPCFHDIRTYWSPEAIRQATGWQPTGAAANGMIHLVNSGATALDGTGAALDEAGQPCMKPFWEITSQDMQACLDATDWCRANYLSFHGGGYSCHYQTRVQMPVTLLRLNIVEGIGPVMQLAEGYTLSLPQSVHETLDKRTAFTWPSTFFAPRLTGEDAFADVYSVMSHWGANHGVTVYGHIGADMITLCAALRIPVSMHNVPTEKIFRPHSWSAFGTQNSQSADYAACRFYGPVYR